MFSWPATSIVGAAAPSLDVTVNSGSIPRYQVVELDIAHSEAGVANVWESPAIGVTFTAPSGRAYTVGGFYHSTDLWKARFAPQEVGTWLWSASWQLGDSIETASGSFVCVGSAERGFIRRHPTNPFRLVSDDGSLYAPIGIGDCLLDWDHSGTPFDELGLDGGPRANGGARVTDIDTYLGTYGGAGFNLFRWSIDNCAFRLWDRIEPAGNSYLAREGRWGDELAVKARRHGLRLYLVLFGFNPPFPNDSADPQRMAAVKRYVKYVVDRYGAYADFWELMNEYPTPPNAISEGWYTQVAGYLREVDPYDHLISTSWERPDHPRIEVNSPHWYEREAELESDLATWRRVEAARAYAKPVIFGEQGNLGQNWDERSALRMRLRAWTAFFAEAALIFWNTSGFTDYFHPASANIYLGPEERGYVRVLQDFAASAGADATRSTITTSGPGVRAYGLRSQGKVLGYLHHFSSHSTAVETTVTLNLPQPALVSWIDPASGNRIRTQSVGAGPRVLTTPPFTVDLALLTEAGGGGAVPASNHPDTCGVFRPSDGTLYLRNSNTSGYADVAIFYGMPGDSPVTGDWDGNGTDTIGIYRGGAFYLRNSNTSGYAEIWFGFGSPGDQPIAGDWNGDGIDTVGVFRNGIFSLRDANSAGPANHSLWLGTAGDVGIAGDWNGTGVDTCGVYRPADGGLYLRFSNTTGYADVAIFYGTAGDLPVTGDWDGNGTDTIGVYRRGSFLLRNSNTAGYAEIGFSLGIVGDRPLAGDWDGQ